MSQKSAGSKNTVLELLRFIFASFIILFHLNKDIFGPDYIINSRGPLEITVFRNGFIGVEFFFMLTGLFMAERVYKSDKASDQIKTGEETFAYIIRKAKSVWPMFAIVAVIKVILHLVYGGSIDWVVINFPSLFFLQRTGLCPGSYVYESWYISSMLIALAVLYPICIKNHRLFTTAIAPVIGLMVYGILISKMGG
ncbi:MAG: acyltransferase family protein [Eubacterium sp.]|nr:acyltransferase family protein [Eubacterium sp.]